MKWSELKWNYPGKSWSLSTLYQPNTHIAVLVCFGCLRATSELSLPNPKDSLLPGADRKSVRGPSQGGVQKSEVAKQPISIRTISHTKHVSRTGTFTSQEIFEIHKLPCFFCVTSIRTLGRTASAVGVTVELCSRRASISQRSSLTPKRSCKGGECMEGIFMNMARLWFLSRCFLNSVFSFWNMILYSYIHNRIRIDIEYTYSMISTLLLSSLQTFSVPAFFTVQHFPQSTFAWPSKEGLVSTFANLHWFITLWFPVTGTMRMRWVGDYLIANFRCTAMGSTIRCSTLDEGFQVPTVDGWNPA